MQQTVIFKASDIILTRSDKDSSYGMDRGGSLLLVCWLQHKDNNDLLHQSM